MRNFTSGKPKSTMKKFLLLVFLPFLLAACSSLLAPPPTATEPATALPSLTATATITGTPTPFPTITALPEASATPAYPAQGYGPANFPADIDPLTGLKVADASLLERRPMIVKIANLPRSYRPQWGLSLADQVYEYYIEEGTTRFSAVYLGQDTDMAGPVRSARFFDNALIYMYKANFAFGSADYRTLRLLYKQPYTNRLVVETSCPPMCRYKPQGVNYLMVNTADLTTLINSRNVPGGNGRQNLDGFLFNDHTPVQGASAEHIYVRYSAAIYNRWDYNTASGKYERFSDIQNDIHNGADEAYAPLTDRLTGEAISADNVVVLFTHHTYASAVPEIINIELAGPDDAYVFRDGQAFPLKWNQGTKDQTITLTNPDGSPFPLKPGNTWFEVIGNLSDVKTATNEFHFVFRMP
jgi:hypothetical protein